MRNGLLPRSNSLTLVSLSAILILTAAIQGQVSTADIIGTAFDPSGSVVVGAHVKVKNLSTD